MRVFVTIDATFRQGLVARDLILSASKHDVGAADGFVTFVTAEIGVFPIESIAAHLVMDKLGFFPSLLIVALSTIRAQLPFVIVGVAGGTAVLREIRK